MARKRIIDPEFWSDEELGQWSIAARLFYIGLWNFADDCGRFKANSGLLKGQIFPYDDPKGLKMEKLKQEVSSKIVWYEVNGLQYGFVRNFLKHQRIDRPTESKLPPPPDKKIVEQSSNPRGDVLPNIREDKLSKDNIREDKLSYADFEQSALNTWNEFCNKYPLLSKIKEITETRRKHLKERFTKDSFKDFKGILKAIEQQPFLIKGNPSSTDHKDWKVSFDWLIDNDTNYIKVLELRYKEKQTQGEVKAADTDCVICSGTGWDETDGGKHICRCRLNR